MENLDDKAKYDRTEKSKARQKAEDLSEEINEKINKGESMAAIAVYLTRAKEEMQQLYSKIHDLNNITAKDKFIVLRNALLVVQKYKKTLKELSQITEPSFLEDEEIS